MYPSLLFKTEMPKEDGTSLVTPVPHGEVCPFGGMCAADCQTASERAMEWTTTHAVDHTDEIAPLGEWDWEYRAGLAKAGTLKTVLAVAEKHGIAALRELLSEEPVTVEMQGGHLVHLTRKDALTSKTLRDLIEDLGNVNVALPLKNYSAKNMQLVIEHMRRCAVTHPGESPVLDAPVAYEADDWDKAFYARLTDQENHEDAVVDLLLLANHLDVKTLTEVIAYGVAGLVKGQTPDELRKPLNLTTKPIPEDMQASKAPKVQNDKMVEA